MHRPSLRRLLPAALAMAMSAAAADQPRPQATPDPLDSAASVPPASFRSSLSSYRRFGDDKPVPWREANDTVGRIGGWRAYAREVGGPAAQPNPAPAATAHPPSASASAPTPGNSGHGSHSTHGGR